MKTKIIAKDKEHLKDLIQKEIELNGNTCDLNHIDISQVEDISSLFFQSNFNGDISKWNVSYVLNMQAMFRKSEFNGDISKWNVENVENMNFMFEQSKFQGDLSNWKAYKATIGFMLSDSPAKIPYWAEYIHLEERKQAIDKYTLAEKLHKELDNQLNNTNNLSKKTKI
jgi:hypothetical protein